MFMKPVFIIYDNRHSHHDIMTRGFVISWLFVMNRETDFFQCCYRLKSKTDLPGYTLNPFGKIYWVFFTSEKVGKPRKIVQMWRTDIFIWKFIEIFFFWKGMPVSIFEGGGDGKFVRIPGWKIEETSKGIPNEI